VTRAERDADQDDQRAGLFGTLLRCDNSVEVVGTGADSLEKAVLDIHEEKRLRHFVRETWLPDDDPGRSVQPIGLMSNRHRVVCS
jgi:hypothetical protein